MQRTKVLVTGGAGFVGENFVRYLDQTKKYDITIFDKLEKNPNQKDTTFIHYVKGNILSKTDLEKAFAKGPFETIFHLASAMPNKEVPDDILWKTNTIGTRNLAELSVQNKVACLVFTSSNVTYGIPKVLPAKEDKEPIPLEIYGKSKLQAEKILAEFKDTINIQIIRCPVISGIGRLGLQAILFEFISENKNVYVLGNGSNTYQFVDVMDVCQALEKASHMKGFDIYNIGADEILTLRQLYEGVIRYAKSSSKIVSIPSSPALFLMKILDKLNLSPLGVYQYTMIGRSLYLDTAKIKKKLKWKPKKTNLDTFIENYQWYIDNKKKRAFTQIGSGDFSANKSLPKMGILRLVKLFS